VRGEGAFFKGQESADRDPALEAPAAPGKGVLEVLIAQLWEGPRLLTRSIQRGGKH